MKKSILIRICAFVIVGILLVGSQCLAVDIGSQLTKAGQGAYGGSLQGTTSLPVMIGGIVKVILGFMGMLLALILIYSGYLYMTAGGEQKQIDKAKNYIRNGIVGLLIVVASYAITTYVVNSLISAVTPTR